MTVASGGGRRQVGSRFVVGLLRGGAREKRLGEIQVGDRARGHPRTPDRADQEQDDAENECGSRRVNEL